MISLDELLVAMVAAIPLEARSREAGMVVESIDVTLPIESQLAADGHLRATAPRGRMRTGFDAPLGELTVAFVARRP